MAEQQCDVVVIGAGPAGMAAAGCAAEQGQRVVVFDEGVRAGGQIWRHRSAATLPAGARWWLERFERSGARLISGATVADVCDGEVRAEQNGVAMIVRAPAVILCTGARELFLPFPGWTLPGVLGIGGGQALLKAGMQVSGKRVVIAGAGPLLLPVAAAFAQHGAAVQLVAEQASRARLLKFAAALWRTPGKLLEAARFRGAFGRAEYAAHTWVTRARGDDVVHEVDVTDGTRVRTLPCDLLCVGHGLVPATELARLAGCELDELGNVAVDAFQQSTQHGIYCAGETTGIGGVEAAVIEGQIAGLAAAGEAAHARELFRKRAAQQVFARRLRATFALRAELHRLADADTVVCRCEDVPFGELANGSSMRAAKLRTRAGMGPCQGRVCGSALQELFGWTADTVRLPAAAVKVATLAND